MSFLIAEWTNLIMANYALDPDLLTPYLPAGTALDLWQGQCYASVVAFHFGNTRVRGVRIPFHVNFEEVNLRFYVSRQVGGQWRRGVVFVKEFVPRRAIVWVANGLFHEHYARFRMWHSAKNDGTEISFEYGLHAGGRAHCMRARVKAYEQPLIPGSFEAFIAEHYYGYSRINSEETMEYEVRHPVWTTLPLVSFEIDIEYVTLHGEALGNALRVAEPVVFVARGSEVSVESGERI